MIAISEAVLKKPFINFARLKSEGDYQYWEVKRCVYCGARHTHGGPNASTRGLGNRVPHCSDPMGRHLPNYELAETGAPVEEPPDLAARRRVDEQTRRFFRKHGFPHKGSWLFDFTCHEGYAGTPVFPLTGEREEFSGATVFDATGNLVEIVALRREWTRDEMRFLGHRVVWRANGKHDCPPCPPLVRDEEYWRLWEKLFNYAFQGGPKDSEEFSDACSAYADRELPRVLAGLQGATPPAPTAVATTQKADVTDVTDVQASKDGPPAVTAHKPTDVTDVTPGTVVPDESQRPCFKVFDDWQTLPDGGKLRPGVWLFGIKAGRKADDPSGLFQQWLCSPLHIEAVTFDGQGNNFGRLLRFTNTLGRWREWAMPMELLRGAGDDLRGELLSMGVSIDPHAKNLLAQYLQAITPKRRVNCALQVGWCGDSFVLPDTVIGPSASNVIYQSGERGHDEHTKAGNLAGWKTEIAARAAGNPLLTLALSASFAGPMLARCNGESGGIHFVGDSSTGKTTAIEAACATWGGPNYRRSWRATANGMEGAAALFNDCLLALDEISECDPKEVGAIVYALGNGRGKQRASRTGNARSVTRWRVMVLSSGERTIGTAMAEGGVRAKAGQSVRLLDVPAARRFGAWDDLHGLANGAAFSDAIRRAAAANHGHAGRAFLEMLTKDSRDFGELLERIKALPKFSADGGEGQDKRTAGRFALMALAGELATEYGITGWPEGAAIDAAAEGFKSWRSMRGRGNDERQQILERVSAFIERHGDSRFSNADSLTDDVMRINRAGWWRGEGSERVYLFNAEGMREAIKGFDLKRALDTLQEAGALPQADASGERAKALRIDGRQVRLYPVHADKLGGCNGH